MNFTNISISETISENEGTPENEAIPMWRLFMDYR